jgi:hypothetical protein
VRDANLVSVALAHDASAIVTDNTRHFSRFADLIGVEGLGPASANSFGCDDVDRRA